LAQAKGTLIAVGVKMGDKPVILRAAKLPDTNRAELDAAFKVLVLPEVLKTAEILLTQAAPSIRGIAVRKTLITANLIDRLPALEIIASYSAGTENIDVAHARARGVVVTNTSHILAEEVANLALAQILALTRDTHNADRFVREGRWQSDPYPLTRSLAGMAVGILGFGHIGSALARRLTAVGACVHYSGPTRKPVDHAYHTDALSLAAAVDLLVVTCPFTPQTTGIVDTAVLGALGPDGYLVNIARGPIVDEAALIAALAADELAGAALDVFVDEPDVPDALLADRRVILSPHIGSGTKQARQLMGDAMVDALVAKLGAVPPVRG
jgi:lactate dehydrogenase-like 2-hydroxyacid dehydrogenase